MDIGVGASALFLLIPRSVAENAAHTACVSGTRRGEARRTGVDQWWSGNRCRSENTLAGSDRSADRLASWCRSIQETRVGDACALRTDATSTPPVDEKDAERQPGIFYAPTIQNLTNTITNFTKNVRVQWCVVKLSAGILSSARYGYEKQESLSRTFGARHGRLQFTVHTTLQTHYSYRLSYWILSLHLPITIRLTTKNNLQESGSTGFVYLLAAPWTTCCIGRTSLYILACSGHLLLGHRPSTPSNRIKLKISENAALLYGEEAMQQVPTTSEGVLGWFVSSGGPARPRQPNRGVRRTTVLQSPGEQS